MITRGNTSVANALTRKKRTPNFPISGVMKPYGLYPIMAHPVLPGETLNKFTTKWRVLSKPMKHPLAGAWLETWLVYVKVTDIEKALAQQFIETNVSTSGYTFSSDAPRYFGKSGQIDWLQMATERFHASYFLDDDETLRTIDGVPMVKLQNRSWMNNVTFKLADDAPDTSDMDDMRREMDAYQMAQLMGLTELTYEAFLGQYGVRKTDAEGMPEILRYAPSWTLPINTVEPSTGAPSTCFMWQDAVELSKPKRFDEPGFVIMFGAVRPKMYWGGIKSSLIGTMWGFGDWFPVYTLDDPLAGVKVISTSDAVYDPALRGTTDVDLWYDHNDLLMHGEQFVNNTDAPTTPFPLPTANGIDLDDSEPIQDLRGQYPISTDIASLFVSATATDQFCVYEGMASMDVSGHVKDHIK